MMLRLKWAIVSLLAATSLVTAQRTASDDETTSALSSASSTAETTSRTRTSSSARPEATEQGRVHHVKVGYPSGAHDFEPKWIEDVRVGDIIEFEMFPRNHSVVRMDTEGACIPIETVRGEKNVKSFYTGFYPVQNMWEPEVADIKFSVDNVTEPIWFYCSQTESCDGYGMVFVANPNNKDDPESEWMEMHERAKNVDYVLQPGEMIPSEDSNAGKDNGNGTSDKSDGGSSLSGGAIAGIVVGAVAAFALVGLLFFLVGRKKKSRELAEKNAMEAAAAAAAAPPPPASNTGYEHEQHPGVMGEHPPMYHDPRYSTQMPVSPRPWSEGNPKHGHVSMMSEEFNPPTALSNHPNRLSELPSQNYDPVEIYTPEQHTLPQPQHQNNVPSPVHEHPEHDNRRSMGPQ